jgi:hypothetical protein
MAFPADCAASILFQFWISRIFDELQTRQYDDRSRPVFDSRIPSEHANEIYLYRLSFSQAKFRSVGGGTIGRLFILLLY